MDNSTPLPPNSSPQELTAYYSLEIFNGVDTIIGHLQTVKDIMVDYDLFQNVEDSDFIDMQEAVKHLINCISNEVSALSTLYNSVCNYAKKFN